VKKRYRIFIIGAGFSRFAGLPLGAELWKLCLSRAKNSVLYENKLKSDIDSFIRYKKFKSNKSITESQIDLEEFISYLDIEHFLALKGSDTMTSTGNETQHLLRNLIAEEIFRKQNLITESQWKLYENFANRLLPGDTILSLNYDTIIETAFERVGRKFRLFPQRFESVNPSGGVVSYNQEEVTVLKLHGSLDWFDITPFEEFKKYAERMGSSYKPTHPVFSNTMTMAAEKIVDGPRQPDDHLDKIFRVRNMKYYFTGLPSLTHSPVILAPSHSKIVYINPIKSFWFGMNAYGHLNFGLSIIGFSLPEHDEYLYQVIYQMCDNYQNREQIISGRRKTKLTFVNFAKAEKDIEKLKRRFNFLDWNRVNSIWEGFNKETFANIIK
jgi:hypothetical protein